MYPESVEMVAQPDSLPVDSAQGQSKESAHKEQGPLPRYLHISKVLIYVLLIIIIILIILRTIVLLNIWVSVRLQQGGNLLFHWIILMPFDPHVFFVISC